MTLLETLGLISDVLSLLTYLHLKKRIKKHMTGSKKFFEYTTDGGDLYGLLADESNTEKIHGSDNDLTTNLTYQLPRNVTPRHAVYADDEGRILKIYVMTTTKFNGLTTSNPSISHDSRIYRLVRKVPERIRMLPIPNDTGLDDGDST